jgi:hypothetical protein
VSDANGNYYSEVLGVKCNPLSDAPLKDFEEMDMFVETPKYKELEGSLNQISHGLQVRVGIIGSQGFGKTTILNYANYYAFGLKVLGIPIEGGTIENFDYLLNLIIREILNHTDEVDMKKEDQERIKSVRKHFLKQWGETTYYKQFKDLLKVGFDKIIKVEKEKGDLTGISHVRTPFTPFEFLLENEFKDLINLLVPEYWYSISILIDEAHLFFKGDLSKYVNFFYIKGISFIFSGYSEMIEGSTSSFMKKKDIFTKRIELDTMSKDELKEMIEKRFSHYRLRESYKDPFTSGAIELGGEVCDFNPYEFIHLCSKILEHAEKKRKDKITKTFVKKWLTKDALRKMEGRSDDEDQILRAIADFGGDIDQDELISYLEECPFINMTNVKVKVEAARMSLKKRGCIWIYQEESKIRLKICASLRYYLREVI